jgi:hypothetical protein
VVLPWHFITAICLSLASGTRVGRFSAAMITVSGLLYHLNDRWVWFVFGDQYVARTLLMVTTLLTGPALALCLMLAHTLVQARSIRRSESTRPDERAGQDNRGPSRLEAPILGAGVLAATD